MWWIGLREFVLVLDGVFRFGTFFFLLRLHRVEFEVTQDGLGPFDDDLWQTGKAGDLDAVAFVGGPGEIFY